MATRGDRGFYYARQGEQPPRRGFDTFAFNREQRVKPISEALSKNGWQPIATVPRNRYVSLMFMDKVCGDFEGACAFRLIDGYFYAGSSDRKFSAHMAFGWRPWTKDYVDARPEPSRGRRG